jgi:phosphopantothenoylcysteine decarboxylase/phosphopantothenate--cysteine ligase
LLSGKKILLGVSGSIAAYKSASLIRLLVKAGAEVKVVMTAEAAKFISPLTLQTLSRNDVYTGISDDDSWNNHVDLGLWADYMLIAPATANTLAKMAQGLCDNMLTACYLSARCPVGVAPAMDLDMWSHHTTRRNLTQLAEDGVFVFPVAYGELASGLIGEGRMAEPEDLISMLSDQFGRIERKGNLLGKRIVFTAGPTYEMLDPVRFLGNASSGKMGLAIASAAQNRGAEVHVIYGPGTETPPTGVRITRVTSAEEMLQTVEEVYSDADAVVFTAAVADYRPERYFEQKIKKDADSNLALRLVKNPDIAKHFGAKKRCIHVGFALESNNAVEYAIKKMHEKNFDLIVLNQTNVPGAGMKSDNNKIQLFWPDGLSRDLPMMSKKELGGYIADEIAALLLK